ncbi:GyrI-like domain-containing protein [Emticicia sp. BO119]|uniref:GyrI-like domain-containing protein n=1 Tax=Emticicia sp. BO119 TaxID=2757768 RepID=UPI0015F0876E|nr:GyrI-like domain-containing protein [Emticicia sp. BO119]MBA4852850.1 GyrI-like domain-containing protein [Emticicia sp. BO119]
MEKLDLSKQYKAYYTATTKPAFVEIEAAKYLSVSGKGDPSHPDYASTLQALYGTAYGVKFWYKAQKQDFVVAKLEGLWWFDETQYKAISMAYAPTQIPRSEWYYRMLIRLPEYVTAEVIQRIADEVTEKKQIALVKQVELYEMQEGKCVQMLHVGPFDKEPESLQQILQFSEAHQLQKNGLHHEIYLSDFRTTAPEKLRTILREPVK